MEKLPKRNENKTISEAMICYFSEKGHNNFFYPTTKKGVLKDGCIYEDLNWLSGNGNLNLKAIKIKNSCVLPLTFNTIDDKNIVSTKNDFYIVVWIDKATQ
jgi:hypothetical protein|tara:strand:- start:16703 stop:17005 length:303 start_codon:yes stop_codon:yes gene_type:complete